MTEKPMVTETDPVSTRDAMLTKWKVKFPALFEGDEPKDLSLVELLEGIEDGSVRGLAEDSFFQLKEYPADIAGQVDDITIEYHEQTYRLMRSDGGFPRYVNGERVREERIDNCSPYGSSGLTSRLSMHFSDRDAYLLVDSEEYEDMNDYYDNCVVCTRYSMNVSAYLHKLASRKVEDGNA